MCDARLGLPDVLPAHPPEEKDGEGVKEVKRDGRETSQGGREIRWLLVFPPRTPSAQDSRQSFISVSRNIPAGRVSLSVH